MKRNEIWLLWAALETSTNTATVAPDRIHSPGILALKVQAICCNVLYYYYCFCYYYYFITFFLTYLLTYLPTNLVTYFYLLLQLICHSVAVVLTLIQTEQMRINIRKETIQKHSTNNTKHSKYKYTYYQNTHTLQNELKQPQYKIHIKWNNHITVKYPQYKVTLMYMVLLSPRSSP